MPLHFGQWCRRSFDYDCLPVPDSQFTNESKLPDSSLQSNEIRLKWLCEVRNKVSKSPKLRVLVLDNVKLSRHLKTMSKYREQSWCFIVALKKGVKMKARLLHRAIIRGRIQDHISLSILPFFTESVAVNAVSATSYRSHCWCTYPVLDGMEYENAIMCLSSHHRITAMNLYGSFGNTVMSQNYRSCIKSSSGFKKR